MSEKAQVSLTYGELTRLAYDAFMLGREHVTLPTGSYQIRYEESGASVTIDSEDGPLRVYTEKPGRETASTRMAQFGAIIIRVSLNGGLLPLGLIDGEFTENVESECASTIMSS